MGDWNSSWSRTDIMKLDDERDLFFAWYVLTRCRWSGISAQYLRTLRQRLSGIPRKYHIFGCITSVCTTSRSYTCELSKFVHLGVTDYLFSDWRFVQDTVCTCVRRRIHALNMESTTQIIFVLFNWGFIHFIIDHEEWIREWSVWAWLIERFFTYDSLSDVAMEISSVLNSTNDRTTCIISLLFQSKSTRRKSWRHSISKYSNNVTKKFISVSLLILFKSCIFFFHVDSLYSFSWRTTCSSYSWIFICWKFS